MKRNIAKFDSSLLFKHNGLSPSCFFLVGGGGCVVCGFLFNVANVVIERDIANFDSASSCKTIMDCSLPIFEVELSTS